MTNRQRREMLRLAIATSLIGMLLVARVVVALIYHNFTWKHRAPNICGAFMFLYIAAKAAKIARMESVRRARLAQRECIFCGYSLTGNVSGVCPECGEKIPDSLLRNPGPQKTD